MGGEHFRTAEMIDCRRRHRFWVTRCPPPFVLRVRSWFEHDTVSLAFLALGSAEAFVAEPWIGSKRAQRNLFWALLDFDLVDTER